MGHPARQPHDASEDATIAVHDFWSQMSKRASLLSSRGLIIFQLDSWETGSLEHIHGHGSYSSPPGAYDPSGKTSGFLPRWCESLMPQLRSCLSDDCDIDYTLLVHTSDCYGNLPHCDIPTSDRFVSRRYQHNRMVDVGPRTLSWLGCLLAKRLDADPLLVHARLGMELGVPRCQVVLRLDKNALDT